MLTALAGGDIADAVVAATTDVGVAGAADEVISVGATGGVRVASVVVDGEGEKEEEEEEEEEVGAEVEVDGLVVTQIVVAKFVDIFTSPDSDRELEVEVVVKFEKGLSKLCLANIHLECIPSLSAWCQKRSSRSLSPFFVLILCCVMHRMAWYCSEMKRIDLEWKGVWSSLRWRTTSWPWLRPSHVPPLLSSLDESAQSGLTVIVDESVDRDVGNVVMRCHHRFIRHGSKEFHSVLKVRVSFGVLLLVRLKICFVLLSPKSAKCRKDEDEDEDEEVGGVKIERAGNLSHLANGERREDGEEVGGVQLVSSSGEATTGARSCSESFMLLYLSGLDCNELDLTVVTCLRATCLREVGSNLWSLQCLVLDLRSGMAVLKVVIVCWNGEHAGGGLDELVAPLLNDWI
ncbi:unnamed protein product [Taenia asiatica]|uniref:Uncharacterized protein n=1 Tax=Taenia asiatica TaxID=60517 RepID=A0A158RAG7_TAEAS|nr:unnamed protein product [Taenia asiatica]